MYHPHDPDQIEDRSLIYNFFFLLPFPITSQPSIISLLVHQRIIHTILTREKTKAWNSKEAPPCIRRYIDSSSLFTHQKLIKVSISTNQIHHQRVMKKYHSYYGNSPRKGTPSSASFWRANTLHFWTSLA